jgi:hypothetical protein
LNNKDYISKSKGGYTYLNKVEINTFRLKELKFILLAIEEIKEQTGINILSYKKEIKKIEVKKIEVKKFIGCLAEYDFEDCVIHIDYNYLKRSLSLSNNTDFKLTLLHEFTHSLDYNSDFELSSSVVKEYKHFIRLCKKIKELKPFFKYNHKEDFINEYSDGLPAFSEMPNSKYVNLCKKYLYKIKRLGYPSFYSSYCVQEFIAETLSSYLLNTYTPKPGLKKKLDLIISLYIKK